MKKFQSIFSQPDKMIFWTHKIVAKMEEKEKTCLERVTYLPDPIKFASNQQETAILFGRYGDFPAAVKIQSYPRGKHEAKIFAQVSHQLKYISPNVIQLFCHTTMEKKEFRKWLADNEEIFYLRELPPGKFYYRFAEYNFSTYPDIKRFSSGLYELMVMERAASPLFIDNLFDLIKTPDQLVILAFYFLWMFYGFLLVNVAHNDFTTRNIWVQPIKKEYRYIQYILPRPEKANLVYYLPLHNFKHFLPKVGDFGHAQEDPEDKRKFCFDMYYAADRLRMHSTCPGCENKLEDVIACMRGCETGCAADLAGIIKLLENPVFTTLMDLPEDVPPGEIITPKMYPSAEIIDRARYKSLA